MSPPTIIFLIATLVTATVTFLTVSRMANQLKQVAPTERASIFLDLPWMIREHNRFLPQSGPMLAFWLSVILPLVWLTCIAFGLATHL